MAKPNFRDAIRNANIACDPDYPMSIVRKGYGFQVVLRGPNTDLFTQIDVAAANAGYIRADNLSGANAHIYPYIAWHAFVRADRR